MTVDWPVSLSVTARIVGDRHFDELGFRSRKQIRFTNFTDTDRLQ